MNSYYVYINSEVKGPFTLSALQENLNAGVWDPDTLCCQSGKNEWTPLSLLFQVRFVPTHEGLVEKVTKKTQELALRAIHASPFKGLVAIPPSPSTTNIVRIQPVSPEPLPEVQVIAKSYPRNYNGGPLRRSVQPMVPAMRSQPDSGGQQPQVMQRIVPVHRHYEAPQVTGREGLGPEHYAMIIGILGIGWGLYYILVKAVSG